MKRLVLLFLPLTACIPGTEGPAAGGAPYAAPTEAEAMAAYYASQQADARLQDARMKADPANNALSQFDDWSKRETLNDPSNVRGMTLGQCTWVEVDRSTLTNNSRDRIGKDAQAGYSCDGTMKLSAWDLGAINIPINGYLFRDPTQRWVFAETD